MDIEQRVQIARETYKTHYNCCQAVLAAYVDVVDLSFEDAMKVGYGFGGGIAGTRQLCGCLSGAVLLLGQKYGCNEANLEVKQNVVKKSQEVFMTFEKLRGSTLCGELLGETPNSKVCLASDCGEYIEEVVRILETYMMGEE